jgi:hypothetical protein
MEQTWTCTFSKGTRTLPPQNTDLFNQEGPRVVGMFDETIPTEDPGPETQERSWATCLAPARTSAGPLRDEERTAQPGQREQDGWSTCLDYCGVAAVYIRTQRHKAVGQGPPDDAETWSSELAITLHVPRPGTPEGEAYQQLIDGTLRLGIVNYINLLSRPTPIGKRWVRTYAGREEAEAGHHALLCYLQMFMEVRRLFHDIVAEMEQQRSAFLLGTPLSATPLVYALLSDS